MPRPPKLLAICAVLAVALLVFASTLSGGNYTVRAAPTTFAHSPSSAIPTATPRHQSQQHAEQHPQQQPPPARVEVTSTPRPRASTLSVAPLDGSLDAALRRACPGGPSFVVVSFANSALADHLRNFVAHIEAVRTPHVIGAVDNEAFTQLSAGGTPTYLTPLAKEGFALDGSNQHASGSWKRFAGMRTGEVNAIVQRGYSVLHCDVDVPAILGSLRMRLLLLLLLLRMCLSLRGWLQVVWLRDPAPFLTCEGAGAAAYGPSARFPCAPMLAADVAVSS